MEQEINMLKSLYSMYEGQLMERDITRDEFREAENELQAVAKRLGGSIYS